MYCSSRLRGALVSERGQSTVEAAFILPVLFVVMGLLLQPAFLLYDQCVMEAAASEGCRAACTSAVDEQGVEAYVKRRLEAVPNLSVFHDGGSDGWTIEVSGVGEYGLATISITNKVKPLPLLGIFAGLMTQQGPDGLLEQRVEESSTVIPPWVSDAGTLPSDWIGDWS